VLKGAGTVSGHGGQTFWEKIRRRGFQFAHPGFDNMSGQTPSYDTTAITQIKAN